MGSLGKLKSRISLERVHWNHNQREMFENFIFKSIVVVRVS